MQLASRESGVNQIIIIIIIIIINAFVHVSEIANICLQL